MDEVIIRVADLTYRYPGREVPAVDGMGFEVARGEVFGFLCPSGAGKTTAQRIASMFALGGITVSLTFAVVLALRLPRSLAA